MTRDEYFFVTFNSLPISTPAQPDPQATCDTCPFEPQEPQVLCKDVRSWTICDKWLFGDGEQSVWIEATEWQNAEGADFDLTDPDDAVKLGLTWQQCDMLHKVLEQMKSEGMF